MPCPVSHTPSEPHSAEKNPDSLGRVGNLCRNFVESQHFSDFRSDSSTEQLSQCEQSHSPPCVSCRCTCNEYPAQHAAADGMCACMQKMGMYENRNIYFGQHKLDGQSIASKPSPDLSWTVSCRCSTCKGHSAQHAADDMSACMQKMGRLCDNNNIYFEKQALMHMLLCLNTQRDQTAYSTYLAMELTQPQVQSFHNKTHLNLTKQCTLYAHSQQGASTSTPTKRRRRQATSQMQP